MIKKTIFFYLAITLSLLTLLGGCLSGGTSGSTTTTAPATTSSSTTFPALRAYTSLIVGGVDTTFTVAQSGTSACSGTGTYTRSPASAPTSFNLTPTYAVSAVSSTESVNKNWTNCTPAISTIDATEYFNSSNYMPLGANVPNTVYNVYPTSTFPAAVSVGDTGIIGTYNQYTNSSESTSVGKVEASYAVTADTATTAIFTIIYKSFNTSNTLTSTENDAWRISTTGSITPVSLVSTSSNGLIETWTYTASTGTSMAFTGFTTQSLTGFTAKPNFDGTSAGTHNGYPFTSYNRVWNNSSNGVAGLHFYDFGSTVGQLVTFYVTPNGTLTPYPAYSIGTNEASNSCAVAATSYFPYVPTCSSIGVMVNRTTGTLSLISSPAFGDTTSDNGATWIATGALGTITGWPLSFTPF